VLRSKWIRIVSSPIRWLANRYPKADNLILFGAARGDWFMDCSRHMFEWMRRNRPDLDLVWMTNSRVVFDELRSKDLPVCMQNSPRALYLLCRARLALISAQLLDLHQVPEIIPDSLRIVFMGHGKSGKASTLAFKSGRSPRFTWMFERTAELLVVAIATSPYIATLASRANGFPLERFAVTGYPRNDEILSPSLTVRDQWKGYLGDLKPKHVALYAPTWRQRGEMTRFFPFQDLDTDALIHWFEERQTLLLLRPHDRDMTKNPTLMTFLRSLEDKTPYVRICDQRKFMNVNHVLPFTDVLLTDYSSIYHDFLLSDRPIVLIPYDFAEFSEIQGFMYDYHDLRPGPAVYTQEGLLSALQEALTDSGGQAERRSRLRSLVHTHHDAAASERVATLIQEHLVTQREPGSDGA